jgi:hypothetical protein
LGRPGRRQILIRIHTGREKAGFSRPFVFDGACETVSRPALRASRKINSAAYATFVTFRYYGSAGWWTTNMRTFVLGLIFSATALPCFAQTVLKSEPLILAPYEIAFVQDASCPIGKVLKVTGAIRGLHRRKACVTLAAEQASLATATP